MTTNRCRVDAFHLLGEPALSAAVVSSISPAVQRDLAAHGAESLASADAKRTGATP